MDKYIWSLYRCKLVYQKRKNGLFYDGTTHERLDPQPTKEDFEMKTILIEVYRDTIEDHNEDNNLSEILVTTNFAKQYFNERIAKNDDLVFGKWALNHTADETMDFYKYAKEHNAIIEIRHCQYA